MRMTKKTVYGSKKNVVFSPDTSWLRIEPDSGVVQPDTNIAVNVSIVADHLEPGIYIGYMIIYHNDPDTGMITIPVEAHILLPDDIDEMIRN